MDADDRASDRTLCRWTDHRGSVLGYLADQARRAGALYLQNYCLERLNESLFFGMIVKEVGLDQRPLYASENIKQLLRRLFPE